MNNNPITIPSKIPLIYYHNLHNLQNLAKCEDPRLNVTEIPKGLIELLQDNDFTINKILDSEPTEIADRLGIDPYVGEIIYKETEKAISKINHHNL
jgi:hypothetical protein